MLRKSLLKRPVNAAALVVVLLPALLCRLGMRIFGSEKGFQGWSQFFALLPGLSGVYLRRAFYRWILPRCGTDVWIGFGTVLSHPTARIGDRVYVGTFCVLGDVTLEEDVLLGSNVSVINGSRQHGIERVDIPIREQPGEFAPVTIGADTWIGDRTVVMADVGKHSVVGAGSVVTKPLSGCSVACGSPARVMRLRETSANHSLSDAGV